MNSFAAEKPPTWGDYVFGVIMVVTGGAVVLFVLAYVVQNYESLVRPFSPDSKLTWGESRIEHIPSEFIRRSDAFAASWELLGICGRDDACDMDPVLKIRDYAIAKDWPMIFDRLIVFDDWGDADESAFARDRFFAARAEFGDYRLRNHCLPTITFEYKDDGRFYGFAGFVCS